MKIQKNWVLCSAATLLLICSNSVLTGQDMGLILPMPGKANKTTNSQSGTKNQPAKPTNSKTLIPLPTKVRPNPVSTKKDPVAPTSTIISIKKPETTPKPEPKSPDDLKIPDEITIEPIENSGQDLLVSGNDTSALQPEIASGNSSGDLPIFPKDTSSAIFMVMKTWQCDDYDVKTLLSHSVKVYGDESVDQFEIRGLDKDGAAKISVDEEDITLDELLDLVANKTGRDWGVDIPSKVIFFYPKGTKTTTVDSW